MYVDYFYYVRKGNIVLVLDGGAFLVAEIHKKNCISILTLFIYQSYGGGKNILKGNVSWDF